MSELKDRIREAREHSGLTAAELARRIGITPSGYSQWENGATKNVRNKFLFALASVTGFNVRYIALGKGPKLGISEPQATYGNTEPAGDITLHVPVISWVQAGDWCGIHDPFPTGFADDYQPVTGKISTLAYALRVRGDSMVAADGNGFPDGAIIIVDPTIEPRHASFVVVRTTDSEEATFKQLVIDGNRRYLRPLNPRYPIIEIDSEAVVCGVVKKMILEADFD